MRKLSVLLLLIILGASSVSISGTSRQTSDEILSKLGLIPEVIRLIEDDYVSGDKIDRKEIIYGALEGMIKNLEDPHSRFIDPDEFKEMKVQTSGEFGGLGIVIGIEESVLTVVSPIDGTPAYKAGICAGDRIIKIDGVSTEGITIHDAVNKLRGKPGSKVTITIMRKAMEKELEVTIVREIIQIKSVRATTISGDVAYMRVSDFSARTSDEMKQAFNQLKRKGVSRIILDLRNNPGGLLKAAVEVSDLFLKRELIVSTKGRSYDQNMEYEATPGDALEAIPVAVLINEGSASASEIVAGAIQDNQRGTIVGVQSYGKGSVQTVKTLSDGSAVSLTTAEYHTPSGKNINCDFRRRKNDVEYAKLKSWGIKPDLTATNPFDQDLSFEQSMQFARLRESKLLQDFAKQHTTYTDDDIRLIMSDLAKEKIEVDENMVRLTLVDELSRRNDSILYYDIAADSQLRSALSALQR